MDRGFYLKEVLNLKKTCFYILVLSFLSLTFFSGSEIFAQQALPDVVPPKVVSPRISGLGAPFTSLEAGIDTLFINPAGFAFLKKRWSAARLSSSMTADSFSLFGVLSQKDKFAALNDSLFNKAKNNIDFSITGPLSLAITGKNFGAGIFNRTIIIANGNSGVRNTLLLGEELFLTGGYGGVVFENDSSTVALGIQMKGFFQTFSYALSATKSYMENAANAKFKNLNLELVNGLGLDVGFLYKYENSFLLGLSCRDAYTAVFCTPYSNFTDYKKAKPSGKTKYKYIIPDLSIGIGTIPVCNDIWQTVSTWAFYIDYRNLLSPIFNKTKSPLLNLAVGTEIILHKVLSFRLGLNECYPHFGCGLNFTYFQFDISAYANEGGNKPWKIPVITVDAALSFEY